MSVDGAVLYPSKYSREVLWPPPYPPRESRLYQAGRAD
jgi:hypothetical protein